MKRLTKYLASGAADYNYPADCYGGNDCNDRAAKSAYRQTCVERLAAYEDTGLTPEEVTAMQYTLDEYHKVADPLLRAQADGRMVLPPCKVGDTVFRIVRDADPHITRDEVRNMYFADDMTLCVELFSGRIILPEKFGKTVFLTREEAEKALEAMKNG